MNQRRICLCSGPVFLCLCADDKLQGATLTKFYRDTKHNEQSRVGNAGLN